MARKTTTKNLVLNAAEKAALRSLAKAWGYTIGRGPMAKEGSIDQLVTELAVGASLWIPVAGDEEYFPVHIAKILEVAKRENLPILERLATALERADKLYHEEQLLNDD